MLPVDARAYNLHQHHYVTDYRIEKLRCPVTVVLAGGEVIAGDIFLNPVSRFRPEPQDPCEFLNEGEAYFALALAGRPAVLVAKENVERMEAPLPASGGTSGAPMHPLSIELTLVTGGVCTGFVLLDTPSGRPRLLDYLNSHRERFLRLASDDRLTLVNRRAIAHVHELI